MQDGTATVLFGNKPLLKLEYVPSRKRVLNQSDVALCAFVYTRLGRDGVLCLRTAVFPNNGRDRERAP